MENFEKATKVKLRFSTTRGQLSVEDLWDLNLESLDGIAKSVNKKLKEESEESFISTKTKSNTELELKLDILKHVISVKLAEKEAKAERAERNAKLSTLKGLLEQKQFDELGQKSSEDIKKMIAELEA